jgi:hypothetical protein
MTGRLGKLGWSTLLGTAIVVAGASVLLSVHQAMAAPNVDILLPEAVPPPPPTSADIAASGAGTTATTSPASPSSSTESTAPAAPIDWTALPIDDVRSRADRQEPPAMEEMARRLIQGIGAAKDPQAGAGWMLRAAEAGSAQAAFNVGVMYEQGFVVERNSTRAAEWYRKAAAANLPTAKHNLALLLRVGKGMARNGEEAVELLRAAARQGMAASMFSLGDIYERGDAAPKDAPAALAWFAITVEFERQVNPGSETKLARTAQQRAQTLQRLLTPAELERAQQLGQSEFRGIVAALSPPKPAPPPPAETDPPAAVAATPPPPTDSEPPGWPKTATDQVRAIQEALLELRRLRDKADGVAGPMTRKAIRDFQRSVGLSENGEPSKEVYVALRRALAARDIVATSPLPPPPKAPDPKVEKPEPAGSN